MSATTSPPSPITSLDRVQEEKRRKHAEAQRRYRERRVPLLHAYSVTLEHPPCRNLATTREKARARMQTLRDKVRASSWRTKKLAKLRRRPADADSREVKRKQKFIARFGLDAFHDYYLPQHEIIGLAHIPGLIVNQSIPAVSFAARGEMAVCEIPFYPSRSNYVSSVEHDSNERKLWFLVLDGGLFTKKSDAEPFANWDEDEIHIFSKRKQAVIRWAEHCRGNHDQSDAAHRGEVPEPAVSTLARATPTPAPRRSPAPAQASPVRAKSPASLHGEESPRKRKSTPVPLFMEDDEPDPWTLPRAMPAPAPAHPPTLSRLSPVRATSLRVEEAPRKAKSTKAKSTPIPPFVVDGEDDNATPLAAPSLGQRACRRQQAPETLTASTSVSTSTSISPPSASLPSVSPSAVSTARARTAAPAFPPRTPVLPSTASSGSGSAARARTAAPASLPRPPVRGSTGGSGSASPRRALSAVPPRGARAEPPPVYAVESGSESEPPSPAPVAPTAHGAGVSPSVSSVSSLSSLGASEGFASQPGSPSPSPSRAGWASPRAGVSSASSASRAGFASPVPRAGFAPSAPSASRAGARPTLASSSAEVEPVLLYNTGSRTFYKNPSMAVREMTEEESVEVVDCEDVGEFLSARAGRRAGESARGV
ncbi:hypothetical protein B0H11DRAFT_2264442 [Mycena galericulata]|nr:hypothetical protein B0H11DRAFT_2264442 [Mycena galericulata]